MSITFYGSFEEMLEAEEKARKAADARVQPVQSQIRAGQHFINFRYGPDLPIFGQILSVSKLGIDDEEQRYIDETYAQPHMKYYRPTKAYSAVCPEGEIGDVHLSEVWAIIDTELFDWYRQNGWAKP
jgi:hypothetical protein